MAVHYEARSGVAVLPIDRPRVSGLAHAVRQGRAKGCGARPRTR
jgi:hypothetical protein